jgi:hypothetical protein
VRESHVSAANLESLPQHTWRLAGLACILTGLLPVVVRLMLLPLVPPPVPAVQDEFSYLLGADTFAAGRITNPPHPMWVHLETFHVNQQPTYGSKYPPAQALCLAFGQRFLGNPWFGVLLSVGLMSAAFCWMLQGWVEPIYATPMTLLAALTWGITSDWMNSYWGGAVGAIGGTLVIGSIPRLVRQVRGVHVTIASLGIVVLANSRPYEGLLTAFSSAVVLLWALHRERRPWLPFLQPRVMMASFLVIAPASAAMGYYNYRTTGNALLLPYVLNERTYAASPRFYLSPPIPSPVYRHEAIRQLWQDWDRNIYLAARANPLAPIVFSLPFVAPFYFFNALGLLALLGLLFGEHDRVIPAILFLSLPVVGVLLEKGFLAHYLAPVCGAWLLLGAAGLKFLLQWRIRGYHAGRVIAMSMAGLAFGNCASEVSAAAREARQPQGILTRPLVVDRLLRDGGRHLILVRYTSRPYSLVSVKLLNFTVIHRIVASSRPEWVYNGADVDRANVVWARDMGPGKNQELLDYYRDRKVWLLEPDVDPLKLTPIDPHS